MPRRGALSSSGIEKKGRHWSDHSSPRPRWAPLQPRREPVTLSWALRHRFDSAPGSEPEVGLVVVAGRELVFRSAADPSASQVEGPPVQHELQVLLLASQDPQLDLVNESMSFLWSESA